MTPDALALIIESLRAGVLLPAALKAARVRADAFADALAADDDVRAQVTAAEREGLAHASAVTKAPPIPAGFFASAPAPKREVVATVEIDDASDAFVRARWEARRAYGDAHPHASTLRWIDARCQLAGMHALDQWWLHTLGDFYETGKLVFAADVGLRGAKSVSVCRSLVNDALFAVRALDPGTIGVIPIMSSDRTEATDRFHTIRKILRACGVAPKKKSEDDGDGEIVEGGLDVAYASRTLPSGGGVIETQDSQGHHVEFRIYPARINGAVGYTGIAGFCDEVDLWPVDLGVDANDVAILSAGGKANPADVVLDRLLERFTTTLASAHLYIVSASYRGHESAHARKIRDGDTAIQYVARLGVLGAERDATQRARLAQAFALDDARLLEDSDPRSPYVPAWVSSPAAPIETCYALSRSRLGPMFGRYGGRPDDAENVVGPPLASVSITYAPPLTCRDTFVGVYPGALDGWGAVAVSIMSDGRIIVRDVEGSALGWSGVLMVQHVVAESGATVLVVATKHEARLRAEISAHTAGAWSILPPVVAHDVHDASVLRVGPLRTLYQRARIVHASRMPALENDIRTHTDAIPKSRVEALALACARLVACYPHAIGSEEGEPIRGPRAIESMHDAGGDAQAMLARLGAR